MNIRKGDKVIVMKGKDKGKTGTVERAFPAIGKILILGMNIRKKHMKARKQGGKGSVVEIPTPIQASNVMIVDPKTGKGTRTASKVVGGKKVRVAAKSGTQIA